LNTPTSSTDKIASTDVGFLRFEPQLGACGVYRWKGIGITSDVYVHLQPDSEIASMRKLEGQFFGDLCSTVLKIEDEDKKQAVN
jgi:hypothetical protein